MLVFTDKLWLGVRVRVRLMLNGRRGVLGRFRNRRMPVKEAGVCDGVWKLSLRFVAAGVNCTCSGLRVLIAARTGVVGKVMMLLL
jgi:hypothetical protein